jgi:hypothetical protein
MKTQKWNVGEIIKFGITQLKITSVITDHKYIAFIYILESLDGKIQYEYIPTKFLYITK